MSGGFRRRDIAWICILFAVIICALLGVIIYNKQGAFDIVSSSATVASIVLSIVAVVYSMVESASSNRVKDETILKLNDLQNETRKLSQRLNELKGFESKLNVAINKASISDDEQDTQEALESLKKLQHYLNEDFEED